MAKISQDFHYAPFLLYFFIILNTMLYVSQGPRGERGSSGTPGTPGTKVFYEIKICNVIPPAFTPWCTSMTK